MLKNEAIPNHTIICNPLVLFLKFFKDTLHTIHRHVRFSANNSLGTPLFPKNFVIPVFNPVFGMFYSLNLRFGKKLCVLVTGC